ncbi:tetratricopeptide repeat protein [Listeria ivanovii]|uniref:TPR domain protein n=1 Tax=Listeria ivanovii (strain ATCC BAA-678 / PAM 55) TaxID=881621 RepID=G2ZFC6_LISIP|nr:hypothetical protein [Listeria ivanovii]AHI56903.1 hypothetical protein AX25_12780 [Listeria ivanovii WSLC3009]AIS66319.1 hypothetical protein JL52_12590 [Listeria ivanovii subsp. ivanovii]MBC1759881.1 hypothetical protein [Listeria ivanovii]MCJ1718161.1 hypothetical protein [Listeria ivanovii]MCJ1735927.1 hypothetical protein [Listeria ivanovii]
MDKNKKIPAKIYPFYPNGQFYFERGVEAFRDQRIKEAIRYLARASELEPGESVILCQLAICYTEIGQFHKSNQLLRDILEKRDGNMDYCYYFIANNFAYMKDYRRALQYANRYLEMETDGDYAEEARDLIEVLLEETPFGETLENGFSNLEQEFYAYKKEINRYLAEEDSASACDILRKVIDEKPNFWPAYNQLASLYFEQLKEAEGVKVLSDLLQRNPGNLLGLCDFFVYHFYKGNREMADSLYVELRDVLPVLSHHKEKLGLIHAMMGAYDAADDLLEQVADLEVTERSKYYYYRAKAAYYIGDVEGAKMFWHSFLECDLYEDVRFPWEREIDLTNDTRLILEMLQAEDDLTHLLGVYALTVSSNRPEMMLFHPLLDMSKWSYMEHLIFTDFDYFPDGNVEQNGFLITKAMNILRENGVLFNEENASLYETVFSLVLNNNRKELILGRYTIEIVATAIAKIFLPDLELVLADEADFHKCAGEIQQVLSR